MSTQYFNGAAEDRERRQREIARRNEKRQADFARELSTKQIVPEDEAYVDRLPTEAEYRRDCASDLAKAMAKAALTEDKGKRG